MKTVRIGDVPLEWFTGAGDLRSHDKFANHLTADDVLKYEKVERLSWARQIILAKRAERKAALKQK